MTLPTNAQLYVVDTAELNGGALRFSLPPSLFFPLPDEESLVVDAAPVGADVGVVGESPLPFLPFPELPEATDGEAVGDVVGLMLGDSVGD